MDKSYISRLKSLLTPREQAIFRKLSSGQKIQDYLDALPINFERRGETYMSPRRVIRTKTAHCFEGALLAAAALAVHGQPPLLMDFRTAPTDEDHVVALFRSGGLWGAISKTNHAILRYRDPVYRSPRELAMSYFHEYFQPNGKKSLRAYSAPFDLRRFRPDKWVTAEDDLHWLVNALDATRHFLTVPKKTMRRVRPAAKVELKAMKVIEWKPPRGLKASPHT
jgi:hypothetical protein